jgi:DNA (cytosine-5)-methyltransferase 1
MVSILGDYNYTFPKPIPLENKLKDMLENNVDEKYFLSDKMKQYIFSENDKYKVNKNSMKIDREIACSKTTREGWTRADTSDYITIKNATKKGYLEATDGDGVDISSRMEHHRGTVQKGKTQTLTTMGGENNGVVVKPKVLGGIGEKDSNNNTQWKQQNRIYDNNVSIAVTTCFNPNYLDNNLRIRKLTPKECGRLMNVKDEDIDKLNLSDSAMYHIFGDSICSNILMALFGEMLDIDWEKKVREMLDGITN